MFWKTLKRTALAAVLGASVAGIASAQTNVYDAHGRVIGPYEPGGVNLAQTLNGDSGVTVLSFGESVLLRLGGVLVAVPVSPAGFSDTPDNVQMQFDGEVFFQTNNCSGQAWLEPQGDDLLGSPGAFRMEQPLVEDGIVVQGVVYYMAPAQYQRLASADAVTICSNAFALGSFPCEQFPSGCHTFTGLLPANSYPLARLGFQPPFSVH